MPAQLLFPAPTSMAPLLAPGHGRTARPQRTLCIHAASPLATCSPKPCSETDSPTDRFMPKKGTCTRGREWFELGRAAAAENSQQPRADSRGARGRPGSCAPRSVKGPPAPPKNVLVGTPNLGWGHTGPKGNGIRILIVPWKPRWHQQNVRALARGPTWKRSMACSSCMFTTSTGQSRLQEVTKKRWKA